MDTIYSWSTKKVDNGFKAIVTKSVTRSTPNANGKYADTEIVQQAVTTTRARARGWAQKWVRYYKAQEAA